MKREKGKYHIYVVGTGTAGEAWSWGLEVDGYGYERYGVKVKAGSVLVQFPDGGVEVMRKSSYEFLAPMMMEHNKRVDNKRPLTQSEETADRLTSIIKKVSNLIDNFTQINYQDHDIYNALSDEIAELLYESKNNPGRYYKQAVLIVHDGFASVYSEDLTLEQLKALHSSFVILRNSRNKFSLDITKLIDRELNACGLYTIPHDKSRILTRR